MKSELLILLYVGYILAAVEGNAAPVLEQGASNYAIIDQKIARESVVHKVQARDPENGTLTFSIFGITYYRNDTDPPVAIFNLSWALTSRSSLSQCSIAESYPFPRNLFCIEPDTNTIKVTSKYSQTIKADFALFAVSVFVIDNGSPMRNLTTNVYFRVRENCNDTTQDYTNLMQKCPEAKDIIKRQSILAEVGFNFIVPNNTVISRVTVDFKRMYAFKEISKNVRFEFSYFDGVAVQKPFFVRRLLANTTLEPVLEIYLWNPIRINGNKENVSLQLRIFSESRAQLRGFGSGIELYLLSGSKDYCANENCVGLYSALSNAMSRNGGKPECARKDPAVVITKYSTCKVVNKPPLWSNSRSNYVVLRRNAFVGTAVFTIQATDAPPQKLLFSIVGVTYYANETAAPVKAYNKAWAVYSPRSSNESNCKLAEKLPWPRNAFCIDGQQSTIKTTEVYKKLSPAYNALFVFDIAIIDNGKPQLNTTGKVYARIQNECQPVDRNKSSCTSGVRTLSWGVREPTSSFFFQNVPPLTIHKLLLDFSGFSPVSFKGPADLTIKIVKTNSSTVLLQKAIYLLQDTKREPSLLINLDIGVPVIGSFTISFEIISAKGAKPEILRSQSSDISPLIIYGLRNEINCFDTFCRSYHAFRRANLRSQNKFECIRRETTYLLQEKYGACGTVFIPTGDKFIEIAPTAKNGTVIAVRKALGNGGVFYSITSVRVWINDIQPPATAKDSSWVVKSKSDVLRACDLAETYAYPRNLLCINSTGFILATSKFANRLTVVPTIEVTVQANGRENASQYASTKLSLLVNYAAKTCRPWAKDLLDAYGNCDGAFNNAIYPSNISSHHYSFTAPSTSLLTQIGLKRSLFSSASIGQKITFKISRPRLKPMTFTRWLVLPGSINVKQFPYLNFSLYDRPFELGQSEKISVMISGEIPLTDDFLGRNLKIDTIPVKDYCLSQCLEKYTRIVRNFTEWQPRFPCRSSDDKFFSAKYGFCLTNAPPTLTVSNILLSNITAGSVIGKLVGTDKEEKALTYGIEWVHSAVLKRNMTFKNLTFHGQSCSEAERNAVPLNYICIVKNTGEIKGTSKFVQTLGETLTVKAYVVDSGKPKRHSTKIFNIQIRDPCADAKKQYQELSRVCMTIDQPFLSALGTGKILEFQSLSYDRVVFLRVDTSKVSFPVGTLYTVFTAQQVISLKPVYKYGAQATVTLMNTVAGGSSINLPLQLSLSKAVRVVLTATAFINSSSIPTMKPIATLSLTTTTTFPPKGRGLRKRRMVSFEQGIPKKISSQNLTLSGLGFRLYVQRLRDHCGSLQCVQKYKAWTDKVQRSSLKSCEADPLNVHRYFNVCLNPPVFESQPKNISLKFNSQISLSCSYRNYTNTTFVWLKDGRVFRPARIFNPAEESEMPGNFGRGTTFQNLRFLGTKPEFQGYYSCKVLDGLNHVIESIPALVHFNDISSSSMSLKLKKTFNQDLNNKNSDEYIRLSKSVITALHAVLDKQNMHKRRSIVINGFRPGSVIVDANVYFMNVSNGDRRKLCPQFKNMSADRKNSGLEIASIDAVSYDCCYMDQTGEDAIKGKISWRTIVANTFDTQRCPYPFYFPSLNETIFDNAHRACLPDFKTGAQWQRPNITQCAYKTLVTYKLENISKLNITDDNAISISDELDSLTSSKMDITNRLDVKFTADAIENLVKSKKKLSEIANNIINITSNVMDFNETYVVESQLEYKSSSRILESLENLANEIPVSQNASVQTVSKNVAFAVQPISKTGNDVIINAVQSSRSGYNKIEISRRAKSSRGVENTAATIVLSSAMLQRATLVRPGALKRVYSFIFENDRLFLSQGSLIMDRSLLDNNNTKRVNSRILSASVGSLKLQNLTSDEEMTALFRTLSTEPGNTECVFWDTQFADGFGAWSSNGCRHDGVENSMQKCRCNHLTNFAILLDVTGKGTPTEAALALSIITYIGCAVSLICLLITFVTFAIFKKLRVKRPPRILMCLCFALIVTLIIFLAGIGAKDWKSCEAVALLIHYFVLVSFMWMAVEGFNLYLSFVKIVGSSISKFILKSSLLSCGLPLVIVAITAGATELDAYGGKKGDEWVCMVRGTAFYVGYLVPILLIVVGNLIVTAFVLKSLRTSSRVSKDKKMDGIVTARIVAACSVLMGTTWVIGLFAVDVLTIPIQVIFCIFNSLQGFFIFIFYCLRNKDARNEWRRVFGLKSEDEAKSSSAGGYQRGKVPQSKQSTDSHKGLMTTSGNYDIAMQNVRSSTLSTTLQDSLAEEKSATLKSFVKVASKRNSDKVDCDTTSETAEMEFGLEPVDIEIHIQLPTATAAHTSTSNNGSCTDHESGPDHSFSIDHSSNTFHAVSTDHGSSSDNGGGSFG